MMRDGPLKIETEGRLKNRVVFITGGSSGTGFKTALAAYSEGARIAIGTRKQGNFDNISEQFDGSAFPVVGDISEPAQIVRAIENLAREGIIVTDVVHAAAGGLEPILFNLSKLFLKWKKAGDSTPDEQKLPLAKEVVEEYFEEAQKRSHKINFEGPANLLDELREMLPYGSRFIFFSSLWSSFFGKVPSPHFYEPIASVKRRFEMYLEASLEDLLLKGMYPAIVSGSVLADTKLADSIIGLRDTIPGSITVQNNLPFPKTEDMVKATVGLLTSDPQMWGPLPAKRYVIGPNQIVDNLDPSSPVFQTFRVNF